MNVQLNGRGRGAHRRCDGGLRAPAPTDRSYDPVSSESRKAKSMRIESPVRESHDQLVTCPHCGRQFPLTDALAEELAGQVLAGKEPALRDEIAKDVRAQYAQDLQEMQARLGEQEETLQQNSEVIKELKTYPLLTGFRGAPPADVGALEDALLRASVMVEDLHQIAELDCNPIIVHERGATIVDARIRVTASEPPSLFARRR